jgi:hypothetical protein
MASKPKSDGAGFRVENIVSTKPAHPTSSSGDPEWLLRSLQLPANASGKSISEFKHDCSGRRRFLAWIWHERKTRQQDDSMSSTDTWEGPNRARDVCVAKAVR